MLGRCVFNLFLSVIFISAPFAISADENSSPPSATETQSGTSNLEAIIDPETGELINKTPQASPNDTTNKDITNTKARQQNVVMTKMSNGSTKVEFNGRFLRPLNVSIDQDGELISHGHATPKEAGAN